MYTGKRFQVYFAKCTHSRPISRQVQTSKVHAVRFPNQFTSENPFSVQIPNADRCMCWCKLFNTEVKCITQIFHELFACDPIDCKRVAVLKFILHLKSFYPRSLFGNVNILNLKC